MKKINTAKPEIVSLESVVRQFEHWRSVRRKRGKIPDTLWALVAPLMNQYSHNRIAAALKVNHIQLKENVIPLLSHQQEKSTAFVEYSLPITDLSIGHCVLEFTCKNGSEVKISGLTSTQVQPLISLLMGD